MGISLKDVKKREKVKERLLKILIRLNKIFPQKSNPLNLIKAQTLK
jgi:hypothetical protein